MFIDDDIDFYKSSRDIPSESNVSRLSPYLTWDNLSDQAIWHSIEKRALTSPSINES